MNVKVHLKLLDFKDVQIVKEKVFAENFVTEDFARKLSFLIN
jgi:hypothetical protein